VLKRQHPGSLSERGWLRLLALDRDCVAARSASRDSTSHERSDGMMGAGGGMHSGRGAWGMLSAASIIAVIAVMMSLLR